jgi:hypothetical protein
MCVCGHPAHHHVQGYCVTVTVTGPASEVHGDRTETMCGCELLTVALITKEELDMANDASDW